MTDTTVPDTSVSYSPSVDEDVTELLGCECRPIRSEHHLNSDSNLDNAGATFAITVEVRVRGRLALTIVSATARDVDVEMKA